MKGNAVKRLTFRQKAGAILASLALLAPVSVAVAAPAVASPAGSVDNIGSLPITLRNDNGSQYNLSGWSWSGYGVQRIIIKAGQCVAITGFGTYCSAYGASWLVTGWTSARRTR